VHRRTDLDTALGRKAAGDPQHFGAVCLHWKVAQRAWIGPFASVHRPAEHGVECFSNASLTSRESAASKNSPMLAHGVPLKFIFGLEFSQHHAMSLGVVEQ
jgi:hypothetical protein